MITTSNEYKIEKLDLNTENTNQYFYIDSVDGNLDCEGGKWYLDLNFYMINNAILPVNTFLIDICTPSQFIENITLTYVSNQNIPDFVVDKTECDIYNAKFYISVVDDNFFEQKLIDFLYDMKFYFRVDESVINKSAIEVDQKILDSFVQEVNLEIENLSFSYSNYLASEKLSGDLVHTYSYYLNSKTKCVQEFNKIYYSLDDFNSNQQAEPIVKLLTLSSIEPFLINGYSVEFNYASDSDKNIKTLKYVCEEPISVLNSYTINYKYNTSYNGETFEVVNTLLGPKGFYLPVTSCGYYQIDLHIIQNKTAKTYSFINPFNFADTLEDGKILINSNKIFINDLSNFNFVRF